MHGARLLQQTMPRPSRLPAGAVATLRTILVKLRRTTATPATRWQPLPASLTASRGFGTAVSSTFPLASTGSAVVPPSVLPRAVAAANQAPLLRSGGSDVLPLDDIAALVKRLRTDGEAPTEAVDWMEMRLDELREAHRDQEALMKRSWSDDLFEGGEADNERKIEGFELELVGMLQSSTRGLADGTILGNAIDLAGAYKKNYKLDKSEAVLLRCTRHAEARSGAWMVKYLNHISQVRMKQRRDAEAVEMMYEIESLATFTLDEAGASEFYETLYRNMSSGLRSMGREDEAAVYFTKMAEAAKMHKKELDWMDLWDLGVLMANRAFHAGRWSEFYKAREIIADALQKQQVAEPNEFILRAKVLSNLGQCYLATGEHDKADLYYSEAYELFDRAVGKSSPLFGMQAWACGNLRCAQKLYAQALPLLGEALYVEAVGDGLSVSEISKLLDQILLCFHELGGSHSAAAWGANNASAREDHTWSSTSSSGDTEPIRRSLNWLIRDPRWAQLSDTTELAVLSHKAALVHVAARWDRQDALSDAATYNGRAIDILQQHRASTDDESRRWLTQAEAVHRALLGRYSLDSVSS